jgi:hypothetical protein
MDLKDHRCYSLTRSAHTDFYPVNRLLLVKNRSDQLSDAMPIFFGEQIGVALPDQPLRSREEIGCTITGHYDATGTVENGHRH